MTFSRDTWLQHLWRRFRFGFRLPHPRYLVEHQMLPPRIQGVVLRRYEDKDFEACRALHDLNATDRFPQDSAFDQIRYLRSSPRTNLVAEVNGEVIGCGGYQLHHPDFATFVYGLVHPRCQGAGIGRLLVFARVAQLPLIKTETCVQIATVKRAILRTVCLPVVRPHLERFEGRRTSPRHAWPECLHHLHGTTLPRDIGRSLPRL